MRLEQTGNKQLIGLFSFKLHRYLYIWNNLFTFCIISPSHPVSNLISKRTISFSKCVLGGWVELLHFCMKQKFAVHDKNIHAVSLTFVRKHAAKAPQCLKTPKNIVFLDMCLYTTVFTLEAGPIPPRWSQECLLHSDKQAFIDVIWLFWN